MYFYILAIMTLATTVMAYGETAMPYYKDKGCAPTATACAGVPNVQNSTIYFPKIPSPTNKNFGGQPYPTDDTILKTITITTCIPTVITSVITSKKTVPTPKPTMPSKPYAPVPKPSADITKPFTPEFSSAADVTHYSALLFVIAGTAIFLF